MDPEEARTFVAAQHRGVLATTRADGRPQLSPVLAVTDGEGRIVVSSRETAYKTRNLLQRPWAALCVFSDGCSSLGVMTCATLCLVTGL